MHPSYQYQEAADYFGYFLQGTQLFKGMPAEEVEMIFDRFERSEYKRGDTLVTMGENPKIIGILRMGELAVTVSSDGPMPEIGGFAYFGEVSLRVRALKPVPCSSPAHLNPGRSWLTRGLLRLI